MPILEITFTGLFLFVPEPRQPKRRLHVLLPATGGNTGVHQHTATLHQAESGTGPIVFANEDLRITGSTGTVLFPPPEAIDLEEITQGKRFPRAALTSANPTNVHARVVLPRATSIKPGQVARWHIDGLGERTLTHRLVWRLEGLSGTSVSVERDPFGNGDKTTKVFHQNSEGVVHLCIQHLPPDHGEQPSIGFEAEHFQAFYRTNPVFDTGPNPTLAQPPEDIERSPCDPPRNADTFTCMVAQVRPE